LGTVKSVVWLVRHGETEWAAEDKFNGWGDIDLNDRGRAQAGRLAERLGRAQIAAVYCSSLRRCRDTAAVVAGPHNLVPIARQELMELHFGAWDGMPRPEIMARYPSEWAAWVDDPASVAPPGGETAQVALDRAVGALKQIVSAHPGQQVVVVAHKAINRLLLCTVLGIPARHYRARLGQRPCALNCIEWSERGPMVTLLNDVSHYVQRPA
jgi:alpha-ribazole phosphatase